MLFRREKCRFKKSKKSKFSIGIFLAKLSQKLLSFDILDGKECFLDQKSEIFKSQKNRRFPKGAMVFSKI